MKKILIIDDNEMVLGLINYCLQDSFELTLSTSIQESKNILKSGFLPDSIITDLNLPDENGKEFIKYLKSNPLFCQIPLIVLSGDEKSQSKIECLKLGADDYLVKPFHPEELKLRIEKQLNSIDSQINSTEKLVKNISLNFHSKENDNIHPKSSFRKRLFDVLVAGSTLIFLSPVIFLVALLIKIDSKGPVFFKSKRIGAGFKVFDLYKFRTMRTGAEKEIKDLAHLNMYNSDNDTKTSSIEGNLIDDKGWQNEDKILENQINQSAFFKFKNDPRITKLGAFLRNTSIDEIPQLINIIKGDMSLVGNRPLPTYEAEKLTKDESVARFLAPAGLTGLWQVTKRGKGELSAKERQDLDNTYATSRNWKFDLKLIAKTFPALLQTEKM